MAESDALRLWLSALSELGEGDVRVFRFRRGKARCEGFVLRYRGVLCAYENRCPHWGIDLDLGDERFYDAPSERIYCKTHGATFLPYSGECDTGPCRGERLDRLELELAGHDAWVIIPDAQLFV